LHDDGDTESEEMLTETPLDEHRIPPAPRRTSSLTSCRSVTSECHTAAIANTDSLARANRGSAECRIGTKAGTFLGPTTVLLCRRTGHEILAAALVTGRAGAEVPNSTRLGQRRQPVVRGR
jgi:hypothetical protein